MRDLATSGGNWDWDSLGQFLPNDCLDLILPIKAPNSAVGSNCAAWLPTIIGEFNLKTGYDYWFEREVPTHARLFKELWRIKALQRLKTFMWEVANDALLINHARLRRGLTVQDICVLCGNTSETTLHALRDYCLAKELWMSIGNSSISPTFFQ